ncbi:MFS family permease [Microbacterium resistens]|uniref:MFS family permease n=1 Tax=Microbacterium resistens TaxID=156977 RepID=A0ABU1SBF4_9MICO|nr:MFS transporter [Microbacterium resistens]MDR6866937.1 MFS family permease [Microbacterium resistens]
MTARTSLWSNARYVAWLVSDTAKGLAQALFGFAVPLLALMITDDPIQAGVIGAVGMGVRVVLVLFGGVLADRHSRIALMVLGSILGALIAGTFTVLALTDALTFVVLLVIDVLLAARSALFDVAGESALKEVVAADTMGRAQAANQAREAVLQLAGGPLGGALLAVGGWLVGLVMAGSHLIAALTAAMIPRLRGPATGGADAASSEAAPVEAAPIDAASSDIAEDAGAASISAVAANGSGADATPAPASRNAGREIREGVAWLFSRTDLRGVLLIMTIINLGFNAAMTTVIYALQQDGQSPAVIGWISAGLGVAMLVGALFAGPIVSRVGAGMLMMIGLAMLTAGAAAMALVREPLPIILILAVPGLLLPPLNAAMMGYFMVATPSALLGRANSATMVFGMGAMPFAPLIAGVGLSAIGREGTILLSAALCGIATVLAIANRSLRSVPAESGWAAYAERFAVTTPSAPVR